MQVFDNEMCLRAARLMRRLGEIHELRALGVEVTDLASIGIPERLRGRHIVNGPFDDPEALAEAAGVLSGRSCPGVYITLNPIRPDAAWLAGREMNRLGRGSGAKAGDILVRRKILIDCDPERPSYVCATDSERSLAGEAATKVRDFLKEQGFPDYAASDSGSGGHSLYWCELPGDEATTGLVKAFLEAINQKLGTVREPRLKSTSGSSTCRESCACPARST